MNPIEQGIDPTTGKPLPTKADVTDALNILKRIKQCNTSTELMQSNQPNTEYGNELDKKLEEYLQPVRYYADIIEIDEAEEQILSYIQSNYILKSGINNTDKLADDLVEKHYQLRIEHNHSDMKWYAYYAGKSLRSLFDDDIDWEIGSDTPTEALVRLKERSK